MIPNDARRFCYLKLAEFYAARLMFPLAAKNMDSAAECATSPRDRIEFYLKEIAYAIKFGDFLIIDKAFKKALSYAQNADKESIKQKLKLALMAQAEEHEKRNKRSNAAQIYERLLEMPITGETEKKHLIEKLGVLNSRLGRLKESLS